MKPPPARVPLVALALALVPAAPGAAIAAVANPPNVVVLLADDQGWADLGVHGNTQARTPNLDALARSGARFERFFVQPVCAPTRAEFLTGRYHPRGGVAGVDSGRERLAPDESTVAQTFRAAGYATGVFGKWHNGGQGPYHPNARGFDEFYGFVGGHWGWYFDAPMEHNGRPVRGRGYIADDITEHALAFMTTRAHQPFLCYVAFNTPHSPFCVPDAVWEKWREAELPLRSPEAARENLAATRSVLAMNENLDWNVGRLLAGLERLGLADNTIVVYFSDNGANTPRWNAGMKGRKTSVDEGGVRSPLFVRWPRHIAAGRVVTEIAGAIDLHPTLARLAGLAPAGAKPFDGVDLSPLLLGTATAWPERLIFNHWAGRTSVRAPRHRLDATGALFDLAADPGQERNISAGHPALTARLQAAVADWRREMFAAGDPGTPRAAGGPRPVVVDERPIPVGHPVSDLTILPAGEGLPAGGVRRSNRFPNCTYFTEWRQTTDTITWEVDVLSAGDYEAVIDYACPDAPGSRLELSFRGARIGATVAPVWNPPLREREDRVPRQESYLKEFRPLVLGTLRFERGRGQLVLRATEIAGREAAEVWQLTLRRRR